MDTLKPLQALTSHDDIAIATLAIMCLLLAAANVGQFIAYRKDRQTLVDNFREDMRNAWGFVEKISAIVKEQTTNIEVIRAFTERQNGR